MKFVLGTMLAISSLFGVNASEAGVVKKTGSEVCTYSFSGDVEPGDLGKLQASGLSTGNSLCLNSEGGAFLEGVDIAEWLLSSGVKTVIRSNAECYSACAIMFMGGGQIEDAYFPNRELYEGGQLGFHAPYSVPSNRNYTPKEVKDAYHRGLQAVAKMMTLGSNTGEERGFIPFTVMIELLKTPPEALYYANTGARIRKLGIDYKGQKPFTWSFEALRAACNSVNGWDKTPLTGMTREPQNTTRNADGSTDFWFEGYGGEASGFCVVRSVEGKPFTITPMVWDASELATAEFTEIRNSDAVTAN